MKKKFSLLLEETSHCLDPNDNSRETSIKIEVYDDTGNLIGEMHGYLMYDYHYLMDFNIEEIFWEKELDDYLQDEIYFQVEKLIEEFSESGKKELTFEVEEEEDEISDNS